MNQNLDELINRLGVSPKRDLLREALTHSSYANEKWQDASYSNERLEFLGDSVLNCAVASYLFEKHPGAPEGDLSKMRARLVCEESLSFLAEKLDVGKYLLLGAGEEATGGRKRRSNLADAVEAIIGAVYLTFGFERTKSFVINRLLPLLEEGLSRKNRDFKTRLQELAQAKGRDISYEVIREEGPDHAKEFTVKVIVGGSPFGVGKGRSKKEAEQAAAEAALEKILDS